MSRAVQEAVAQGHSIHSSCQVFGLPRASCYRYASLLKAAEIDDLLRPQVQQVTLEWSCYGYRRVTHELKRQGVRVNHKRVLRLMREENPGASFKEAVCGDDQQQPPPACVSEPRGRDGYCCP